MKLSRERLRNDRTLPNASPEISPYKAYAVDEDGSRHLVNTRSLVIDVGVGEFVIDLIAHPLLIGQLRLHTDGLLVIGHGDASSVRVGIRQLKQGTRGRAGGAP